MHDCLIAVVVGYSTETFNEIIIINKRQIFFTPSLASFVLVCEIAQAAPACLPACPADCDCVFGPKTEMGSVYNLISRRPKPIIHRSTPRLGRLGGWSVKPGGAEEEQRRRRPSDHHELGLIAYQSSPF